MLLTRKPESFWRNENMPSLTPLTGGTQADTVIVGAGMCGLLCAYMLRLKGVKNIVIIDAGEICGGVTADTTAKITSQHGLIYTKLWEGWSESAASQYASANENAVRLFREIIEREQINCDFTICDSWVYTTDEDKSRAVLQEAQTAQKLGIDAKYDIRTELPFSVKGAVKFSAQAHFHPLKFACAICDILLNDGCRIYSQTAAAAAADGIVYTDRGDIHARQIICATHYPFIDKRSLMFTKVFQERSYVAALRGAGQMKDMYLDCEDGGFSFRPQKDLNGEDMILFGAYDHKTGHEDDMTHYDGLIEEAARLYLHAEPAYMWSAQDCMTHDGVPYIGRYEAAGDNIFIATGFNKWGMTSSMAAADIISDMITKGGSSNSDVFSPDRRDIRLQAKSFIKESVDIAGNFLTHLTPADDKLLKNNEGGVVDDNGRRVGVYKDKNGRIYAVKPVCTHMGCAVKWNKDENTWDCTCHGSRFDYEGNVLGGPAMKPLERITDNS